MAFPPKKPGQGPPKKPGAPQGPGADPMAGGPPPPSDPFGGAPPMGGPPIMPGLQPGAPKPGSPMDPMAAMMNGFGPDPMDAMTPQAQGPPLGPNGLPVGGELPQGPGADGDDTIGQLRQFTGKQRKDSPENLLSGKTARIAAGQSGRNFQTGGGIFYGR